MPTLSAMVCRASEAALHSFPQAHAWSADQCEVRVKRALWSGRRRLMNRHSSVFRSREKTGDATRPYDGASGSATHSSPGRHPSSFAAMVRARLILAFGIVVGLGIGLLTAGHAATHVALTGTTVTREVVAYDDMSRT